MKSSLKNLPRIKEYFKEKWKIFHLIYFEKIWTNYDKYFEEIFTNFEKIM